MMAQLVHGQGKSSEGDIKRLELGGREERFARSERYKQHPSSYY